MQAFLIELVNHFKFGMTGDSSNIKRVLMVAMVRGQEGKGVRMPLGVRFSPPGEDS